MCMTDRKLSQGEMLVMVATESYKLGMDNPNRLLKKSLCAASRSRLSR